MLLNSTNAADHIKTHPVAEQAIHAPALAGPKTITPVSRVINVDRHAAYPKAIADLKAAGFLPEQVERETRSNT